MKCVHLPLTLFMFAIAPANALDAQNGPMAGDMQHPSAPMKAESSTLHVFEASQHPLTLYIKGLDEGTVTWQSVGPQAPGTFNDRLNCRVGCDRVNFKPSANDPAYIDFKVCGTPLDPGQGYTLCHMVRVVQRD